MSLRSSVIYDPIITQEWLKACELGDINTVKINHKNVNPSCKDNQAIRMAAKYGRFEVVQFLLTDIRVDPSAGNCYPLRHACINGFY